GSVRQRPALLDLVGRKPILGDAPRKCSFLIVTGRRHIARSGRGAAPAFSCATALRVTRSLPDRQSRAAPSGRSRCPRNEHTNLALNSRSTGTLWLSSRLSAGQDARAPR